MVRGNLIAMIWNDKQDMNILTNVNRPPAEGNFCDKNGKVQILSLLKTTNGT